MTEEEPKQELSKSQLKKLAKKAEKEKKKQQKKQGTDKETDPAAAPSATTSSVPKKKKKAAPLTLLLHNVPEDDKDKKSHSYSAALKAVWASLTYEVPLQKSTESTPLSSLSHGPTLTYGESHVMGGNSMAKAIANLSKKSTSFSASSTEAMAAVFKMDEWCEWERVHLRPSHPNLHNALGHLEHVLTTETASPYHLVGHATSLADIVICTSLSMLQPEAHLPPHVLQYAQAHSKALESSQQALKNLPSHASTTTIDLKHPSLNHVVEQVFRNALVQLLDDEELNVAELLPNAIVTKCTNPKHGDYQCNAAMPLFSALRKVGNTTFSNPTAVAHGLLQVLEETSSDVVTDLTVNGPGFVTCRIAAVLLQRRLHEYFTVSDSKSLPLPPIKEQQTCLVDFSSPNIAKEMHVGHLRSTILGESMCRILNKVGHSVHRVNHVGDWGTQFGMLIQYLKEEFPEFHSSMPNITDLTEFYKSAKQRFDESPEFKKLSQTNVVKLQSGDAECMEIWKILCDISRKEFEKVYRRLDITVKECGESFYNKKIPPVVEEFNGAGLLSIEEGGAKCVFVENYSVPLMLVKSDGGFGYDSTDMAALKYRLQELKCQRIIVVTDFSQADHFKMCYSAARKIGWTAEEQQLEHVGFGTVMGEDGKRFKTRSGDTVRLVDLLDEAVNRMEASLKERISQGSSNISPDEVHKVAEAIGYGAVKYFDLRRNPTSNYKFSYDQMLDTKGNTAVYLLYAHARLESICSKAKAEYQVDVNELMADKTPIVIEHPSERNLAFHLQLFADTLAMSLEDLFPYHICEYLYNLSIAASDFATQCKVLGSPEMKSRLLLCRATTMAMRECFDLLAIRHVESI